MKYQKLENQEANWKWIYLIRKHREGEKITRYEEKSLEESKVQELIECQNYPEKSRNGLKITFLLIYLLSLIRLFVQDVNAFLMQKNNQRRKNLLI